MVRWDYVGAIQTLIFCAELCTKNVLCLRVALEREFEQLGPSQIFPSPSSSEHGNHLYACSPDFSGRVAKGD